MPFKVEVSHISVKYNHFWHHFWFSFSCHLGGDRYQHCTDLCHSEIGLGGSQNIALAAVNNHFVFLIYGVCHRCTF